MGNERERLTNIARAIKAERADGKGKKDKQDKLAKVVKSLTKAEYDALPKALQKELKDLR